DRDEDLVPVSGRPPSLIHRPSGCHFHPRCPYSQPEHTRIDPQIAPVAGRPGHAVACLLAPDARRAIWGELRRGRDAERAAGIAGLEVSAVESDANPMPTVAEIEADAGPIPAGEERDA
ncbi:MAG TPA: oligopeptide/dipeptide ABC transporter ATP-binding protein, partial [Solirubrobacteraceae bacterium]